MAERKKRWIAPGDGTDHFTALPLELRAQIVSLLPFWQIVQLSTLSRPWRHIHHHTPVVKLYLDEFVYLEDNIFDEDRPIPGAVNEAAILDLRVALGRRAQDGSASKVDALDVLDYGVADPRLRRHADRIIALADARKIRVTVPYDRQNRDARISWKLDLPPAARHLHVEGAYSLAPAITGPGAAALLGLCLSKVSLSEWPCFPSLRDLTLDNVTVEAPFTPAVWFPLLENLSIVFSTIQQARVDIRLPHLKSLDMEGVDVCPHGHGGISKQFGDITIDAPELEELELYCEAGCTTEYKSFTLRAPRLRYLGYQNQFAGRVDIDVGRPGSVRAGSIMFDSNEEISCPEMKLCRMQMMRMLQGLIPELSPEDVAHAARPHMTLDKYSVESFDSGMIPEEKLTCNLSALMPSLKI